MSHPRPKLTYAKRRDVIRQQVGNKSLSEIAELCGVDRRTIYRDIDKLKTRGLWYQWIEDRFIELLAKGNISDEKKLLELGKLYGKQFTEKHQVETKGEVTFRLEAWRPTDAESEDTVPPT